MKGIDMENGENWNYDELATELANGYDVLKEELVPFVLEEARRRKDAEVVAYLARWFEDRDNTQRYLELAIEAAELGSPHANFWLGHDYLSGERVTRDFEKAYSCFIKAKECGWAPIDAAGGWIPIDPEDNPEIMEDEEGEVTSEYLFVHDIEWWLFLLENHPTRALKCGLADWYMKQGGEEDRAKALKLLEESANEGFGFAFYRLIKFYANGEFKDIEKGRYWFWKAEEQGIHESMFAKELGVESFEFRELKEAADKGDSRAAGKLACAYLHGECGDYECEDYACCAKNEALALHYGAFASATDEGIEALVNGLDDMNLDDQQFLSKVTNYSDIP